MNINSIDSAATDAEAYVVCPYNKSHVITRARLSFHLVKCRRSSDLGKDLVACSFNSNHVIPRVEKIYHESNCGDRLIIDKFLNEVVPANAQTEPNLPKLPQFSPSYSSPNEECWDNVSTGYSVLDAIKQDAEAKEVFMVRQTASSKAVRKAYREQEKARFQECESKSAKPKSQPKPKPAPAPAPALVPTPAPAPHIESASGLEKPSAVYGGAIPKVSKPKPTPDTLANDVAELNLGAAQKISKPRTPPGFGNAPPGFSNVPPGFGNAWGKPRTEEVRFEMTSDDFPKLQIPIGRGRRPPKN